jgi:cysteine synthase A
MSVVGNADSVGAMLALSELLGRPVGPSTGTNLVAMLALADEMRQRGESGSVLSLLCDSGERYRGTYFCAEWAQAHCGDVSVAQQRMVQQLTAAV